jgi:hypothetical protein
MRQNHVQSSVEDHVIVHVFLKEEIQFKAAVNQ